MGEQVPGVDPVRVLVVDDENSLRHVLARLFERKSCEVKAVGSAESALRELADYDPAIAMLDIVLPGKSGLELLGEIKLLRPDCEVVMMTSHASLETAVRAIRAGAYDYLIKPFDGLEQVWLTVERALQVRQLRLENQALLKNTERLNRDLVEALERLNSLASAKVLG